MSSMAKKLKKLPERKVVDRSKPFREQYEKAMDGRHRTMAIRVYCLQCCLWQPAEVRLCTCTSCPLYPYRLGGKPASAESPRPMYPHPDRCHGEYERALSGRSRRSAVRAACRLCSDWNDGEVRQCDREGCALHPYRLTGCNVPTDGRRLQGKRVGLTRKEQSR